MKGDHTAQYALAGFAEYSEGGEGEREKIAGVMYSRAAAQGNAWAQCRLGSLVEEGSLSDEIRGGTWPCLVQGLGSGVQ